MDPKVLHDHLTELHQELGAAPSVDAASTRLLGELMQDIKQLLARSSAPDLGTPATPASLPERLEKIAVLFEVDHPTLASSSRRLVDLLGKVGL
jgi:hypothetical protein